MPETEPLDSALDWVADHTRRYVASGGEDGHDFRGAPCLVLTTTGRRSGAQRRNALIYGVTEAGDHVIVASMGGAPTDPLWHRNLLADPAVEVQVRDQVFGARARVASAEERPGLWALMTGIWPAYDEYQAKTDRVIPIVVLERT